MPWLGWKAGWFVVDILKRHRDDVMRRTASEDESTWGDHDPNDAPMLQIVIDEIEAELGQRKVTEECMLRLSADERSLLIEAIDVLKASGKVTNPRIDTLRLRLLAERGYQIQKLR
jgi:hypothetical protein